MDENFFLLLEIIYFRCYGRQHTFIIFTAVEEAEAVRIEDPDIVVDRRRVGTDDVYFDDWMDG